MDVEDEKALNEEVQEFQQQFVCYREVAGRRFQELEEMIELAARKMEILQRRKALKKRREVFKDLAHAALETYTGKPIYDEGPVYDEEPGEGQECWPEHELFWAALEGDNSNSPDLLQSELCTSEGLEADLKNKPNKVLKDGDKPKLVDGKGEERQGVVEEKSSIILANRREKLIEDVPCGDSPIAANSSGWEKKSSHLNQKNMIIFDPGGLVQDDHSEGINMMFKNMISIEEVKLEKVALINSACGQPGQWQGHPKFVVQIEISDGIQGRQGKPGRVLRLEDQEASRKKNTITIFDPGGYLNCFYHVQFGGSIEFLNVHYPLPNVLDGEELHTKRKENIVMFSSITNAPGKHFQKLVLAFCGDILLGEVYVTQLKDSFEVHNPP